MDESTLNLVPVRKVTLVESVMEQIIAQIKEGRLKPGDRLPSERELMSMMSVGRSTVREAIQGLAAMDLLESRPGQGTFVKEIKAQFPAEVDTRTLSASLQRKTRLQLLEARLLLETGIVTLAVERATSEKIQALAEVLDRYVASAQAGDWETNYEVHRQFHRTLGVMTENDILLKLLDSLLSMIPPSIVMKHVQDPAIRALEMELHRAIFEAVKAGDVEKAREAIAKHMASEQEQIAEAYGEGVS
ncbi:MAG TPA: FadR family transcriptional regulator [Anaerolineae bacterium]|nr:FadR family transcriptional regulator [Anaerolineae bacterium]